MHSHYDLSDQLVRYGCLRWSTGSNRGMPISSNWVKLRYDVIEIEQKSSDRTSINFTVNLD